MSQDTITNAPLREEIVELGELLGQTISEIVDEESLKRVEAIRQLSRDHRGGDAEAEKQLHETLASLDENQLRVVIRSFTIFLDLANLAEDRERVRVLRERTVKVYPEPRGESVEAALVRLKAAGKTAAEVQELLDHLQIELVFTAHPTEAKRRSVRRKLRRIRELLTEADTLQLPAEREHNQHLIRAELAKLWLTDFIRPWRPTVLQEVRRGLSIKPVLWEVAPQLLAEIRAALAKVFPGESFTVSPCVTYGSWIGGDRDGHPYVTAEVTEQTVLWLRQAALEFHVTACRELFESLSLSRRQMSIGTEIDEYVAAAIDRWPALEEDLAEVPPNEIFRRWLRVVLWRLQQTQLLDFEDPEIEGAYASPDELETDVTRLYDTLHAATDGELLSLEVATWIDRIRIFGFHLARLDVRQDSRQYEEVMNELFTKAGFCDDPSALNEAQRQELLASTFDRPLRFGGQSLSPEANETIALFQLLRRIVNTFGMQALGGHVVSMTRYPSDMLTVLWLWQHSNDDLSPAKPGELPALPTIPLFETIVDLQESPSILGSLLKSPVYRENLRRLDDKQIAMLGYSDSTKDGGYLSACWSLFCCQQKLHELASAEGIELSFFHGRGGSLGRGGGPAARSILSLPAGTFNGSLRLTEQGEVLADRYDDPRIAHRHTEQVIWSSLLASGLPTPELPSTWYDTMQVLSEASFKAYRELVEQPGFVDFFRRATPISEVEQLQIGSRPARRRGGGSLSDLRAIPWVFSWTQARYLVPAWYGLGSAFGTMLEDPAALETLTSMYRDWPFFRATIDNAELALAKTDLTIAEDYAKLANGSEEMSRIGERISTEFDRSRRGLLAITGNEELLDGTPWLRESIRLRNWYIDPLNLIQIELLRRSYERSDRGEEEPDEELQHLTRFTIKGLASGMRTSG